MILTKNKKKINEGLERSKYRDDFKVERITAVTWDDLRRYLVNMKPYVVHFAGHGAGEKGLILEDENGKESPISTELLAELISVLEKDRCECFLLNACYTKVQAEAIAKYINYVIGMKTAIPDELAIAYSVGFYERLGSGSSIYQAHQLGCVNLKQAIEKNLQEYRNCIYDPDETKDTPQNFYEPFKPEILGKKKTENDESVISQTASHGLYDVADLMSNPVIYATLQSGKDKLQEVKQQIEIVTIYKDIHDQLHYLEFTCYNMIKEEIPYFPDDRRSLRQIRIYKGRLIEIICGIKSISGDAMLESQEMEWIQDLEEARSELEGAINTKNLDQLKTSYYLLNAIIAEQSNCIDVSLKRAAEALHLQSLIEKTQEILQHIEQTSNNQQKIQESITALQKIDKILKFRINDHYQWQNIDNNFRRIDGLLNKDLDELVFSWKYLKGKVEKQYHDCEESWAMDLKTKSEKLDELMTSESKDSDDIKDCFLEYRTIATSHFFKVDHELKNFCEQLKKVSEPLNIILEKIR